MAFTGPVEDRLAIRDLYGCYADASARGDADVFLSCWTEDGEWNTHIFKRSGKQALREQWDMLWTNFEKVALLNEICAIEVDGAQAAARIVAREIVALKGGGVFKLAGMYRDRLVRRDGRWLFARRDYELLVEERPG